MRIADNEHRILNVTHDNGQPPSDGGPYFEITSIKLNPEAKGHLFKQIRMDRETSLKLAHYILENALQNKTTQE